MKVQITEPAGQQLKEIYQYYKTKVSQEVAEKIKNSIISAIIDSDKT